MHRRDFIKSGAMLCLSSLSMVLIGCDVNNNLLGVTAQYPSKPITVIVPFAAGGSADIVARNMEEFSIKYFGQPFVITNKPGGGGMLGWNELVQSPPDGYLLGIVATAALLQPLYGSTRYHYPTALEPLVQVASVPQAVVVLAESPWQTIGDLVEYAKAHPGELKFSHAGLGTGPHVAGEMFAKTANINIVQVPFQGDSEALATLLGGHVQLMIGPPFTVIEYVKSGTVRILTISGEQRLNDAIFKNVPTLKENGINVVISSWWGVGAPKLLPVDIKEKLDIKLSAIVNDAEFKTNMEQLGLTVDYLGPNEFKDKWNNEAVRLKNIVEETGIAAKIVSQKN